MKCGALSLRGVLKTPNFLDLMYMSAFMIVSKGGQMKLWQLLLTFSPSCLKFIFHLLITVEQKYESMLITEKNVSLYRDKKNKQTHLSIKFFMKQIRIFFIIEKMGKFNTEKIRIFYFSFHPCLAVRHRRFYAKNKRYIFASQQWISFAIK